jgi:hypothetical protein
MAHASNASPSSAFANGWFEKRDFGTGRAYIKRQKTRWASCSRHKTISLNAKLLFLPSEIVDLRDDFTNYATSL